MSPSAPAKWNLGRFDLCTDDKSNGDSIFDTIKKGNGPGRSTTTIDTAGCSCEQIIAAQGLGEGHTKHGGSILHE